MNNQCKTTQPLPMRPTQKKGNLTNPDKVDWLRLIRSRRVGPATFFRLLNEHGTASAAIDALPQLARNAGVKGYAAFSPKAASEELHAGQSQGMQLIGFHEPNYPQLLRHIPDPPPLLWALGDVSLLKKPAIAIVGARNASSLGGRMTRQLAKELGEAGNVVVSGLARGIDAAAHTAALGTGTIAVQAGGIDVVYPRENATLHQEIAETGLRLSEHPLGLIPQARHFPQRNRIIAGLSLATIVVEGALRSGSLITAKDAADLGRDVMAVPGSPMDPRAAGYNALIRDGALLVRSAQDVIDALEPPVVNPSKTELQPSLPLSPPIDLEDKILSLLGPNAVPEDALIRDVGLPAAQIAPHLTTLELEGKIHRQPGGMLTLSN